MPFKSEKQRKWMWANDPKMAAKWEKEEKKKAKKRDYKVEHSMKLKYNLKNILVEGPLPRAPEHPEEGPLPQLNNPVNVFGYGNNPELDPDIADYSNGSDGDWDKFDVDDIDHSNDDDGDWDKFDVDDIGEELGSDSYDPELSGYEAIEKISQEKADDESRKKDFWKHLFNKIAKHRPTTEYPEDAPEDDIKPVWNQFLPMQETDS